MRLHRPSQDFGRTCLSFSGTPLFMLFNISTSFVSPARSAKRAKALVCDRALADAKPLNSHRMAGLCAIWAQECANHRSTRRKSASMDGNEAEAGFCMSFFCGPLGATLDDESIGFSTRRDDPSNRKFSSIDNDR